MLGLQAVLNHSGASEVIVKVRKISVKTVKGASEMRSNEISTSFRLKGKERREERWKEGKRRGVVGGKKR